MKVIHARNVNSAFYQGLRWLNENHTIEGSRNGQVAVATTPVTTAYSRPWERVLFSPMRDANPFFHVMESLWMIAGRRDVAWPALFNSTFGQFSDNAKYFHGAYGWRWRHWFVGCDQLTEVIRELKNNPQSRRCVIAMWSPNGDLVPTDNDVEGGMVSKDLPCNTHIYLRVNNGELDMTVCNRSNDVIWGAYGANAVHMSFLHEYLAAGIGVDQGMYYQVSNNFHVYLSKFPQAHWEAMMQDVNHHDVYEDPYGPVEIITPFVNDFNWFDLELDRFLLDPRNAERYIYRNAFFPDVALPMYDTWMLRKEGDEKAALQRVLDIQSHDWRYACDNWMRRRIGKGAQNVVA